MWQTKKIENLTIEQKALIPIYREKWRKNIVSTQPIDREKAKAAVNRVYFAMGKKQPEILFLSSPDAIPEIVGSRSPQRLVQMLGSPLVTSLEIELSEQLASQIDNELWVQLENELPNEQLFQLMFIWQEALKKHEELLGQLWYQWQEGILSQIWAERERQLRQKVKESPGGKPLIELADLMWENIGEPLLRQLDMNLWQPLASQPLVEEWEENIKEPILKIGSAMGIISNISQNVTVSSIEMIDFCISALGCDHDREKWQALQGLVRECGFVLKLENTCLVCDRPIKLSLDQENHFHAEGEPAIKFIDGYSIYAYQGVRLPERYGLLHPNRWQAKWLLTEENAELRRVLIQGIGYSRICHELAAVELDSWRE